MIIRIMGEGQFDLSDVEQSTLQSFDDEVERAVEVGDESTVRDSLRRLHDFITSKGARVADDYLGASDILVPGEDATLAEIHEMLSGEGFIPNEV